MLSDSEAFLKKYLHNFENFFVFLFTFIDLCGTIELCYRVEVHKFIKDGRYK